MPKFESRVTIHCGIEDAFDFLCDPQNLVKISPPETNMELLSAPETLVQGSRIRFSVKAYGHKQIVEHDIIHHTRPSLLSEHQVTGPMKKWVHHHQLRELPGGKVELTDEIEFAPPGGLVGLIVNEKFVRRILDRTMSHRAQVLRDLLESATAQAG